MAGRIALGDFDPFSRITYRKWNDICEPRVLFRRQVLNRRVRVGAMHLIKIDVVSPKPLKTGIGRFHYVFARKAFVVRCLPHSEPPLGRNDQIVASMRRDRFSYKLLRDAIAVHIRSIDEITASLNESVG